MDLYGHFGQPLSPEMSPIPLFYIRFGSHRISKPLPFTVIRDIMPRISDRHPPDDIDIQDDLISAARHDASKHYGRRSEKSQIDAYRDAAHELIQQLATTHPSCSGDKPTNPIDMPIFRHLENTFKDAHSHDYASESNVKILNKLESIIRVANMFGSQTIPKIRATLDFFFLLHGQRLAEYPSYVKHENPHICSRWLQCIRDTCSEPVKRKIEDLFAFESRSLMPRRDSSNSSTGGVISCSVVGSRGRKSGNYSHHDSRFESELPDDLKTLWDQSRSVFVAVSPKELQQWLYSVGPERNLVPPASTGTGELLDTQDNFQLIEIRMLQPGSSAPVTATDKRLKQRISEFLLRSEPLRTGPEEGHSGVKPWFPIISGGLRIPGPWS
ncbi:hypothetical protein BZA77DRAFT_318300 [Pyronema omphalodes]|nr:hypothetical protein BZA77DRAFT_318300 [Pyronema omphalodes]